MDRRSQHGSSRENRCCPTSSRASASVRPRGLNPAGRDKKSDEGGVGGGGPCAAHPWRAGTRAGRKHSFRKGGWRAPGLVEKPRAERTWLNSHGWALGSPGGRSLTHLGSATASWALPPFLCTAPSDPLGSARLGTDRRNLPGVTSSCFLVLASSVSHASARRRERFEEAAARLRGRRGQSGEAGTGSAGKSRGRCSRGQLVGGAAGLLCRCLTASGAL